jgi:diguanylate cyclase (GGDEF)-like protein
MVSAVVAAFTLVVVGVLLVAGRYLSLRSGRQTEGILRRIDGHLEAISTSVAQAVDRIVEARSSGPQLLPTLDFNALVDTLLAEAAARTAADAVVLRVHGPGRRPFVASVGEGVEAELLEWAIAPPDRRSFRAATVDWTYAPFDDPETAPFRSALVVPLDVGGDAPGAVGVFSTSRDAFRAEHAATLRALVEEAGIALANARRFADVEARAFVDPASGVPDRRGYEIELERAVARARRTGQPLTVAIVAMDDGVRADRPGNGVGELARLVGRVTRGSDVSCRRGGRELAILLPETRESEASRLTVRLREEARRALGGSGQTTFAVGLAEWRPNESVEALDARAAAALSGPLVAVAVGRGPAPSPAGSAAAAHVAGDANGLRADVVEALAHRMDEALRREHSVTVVALDVTGLDDVADRLGRDVADAALSELARQLDRGVGDGSVHRTGRATFALVLAGSSADAEALLGTLQAGLGPAEGEYKVRLSAGVTEIVPGDDGESALARAEHALWQARQAGPGTVVVALAAPRAPDLA